MSEREQVAELLAEMKKLTFYLLSACILIDDDKARQKAREVVKNAEAVMKKHQRSQQC